MFQHYALSPYDLHCALPRQKQHTHIDKARVDARAPAHAHAQDGLQSQARGASCRATCRGTPWAWATGCGQLVYLNEHISSRRALEPVYLNEHISSRRALVFRHRFAILNN